MFGRKVIEKIKSDINQPSDVVWNNAVKNCVNTINEQPTVEAKPSEEMVIKTDKIQSLRNCLKNMCWYGDCDDCEFFEPTDDTDGDFFCAIRDKHEEVPFREGWDMSSAFMRKKVE